MDIDIKYALRESIPIRLFAAPIKRRLLLKELEKYSISEYPNRIKKYCRIHEGERCFIVGNGPSLCVEDIERIANYPTFASNSIFKIYPQTDWRPTYYLCVDPTYIDYHREEIVKEVNSTKFISCRAEFPSGCNTERIFEYNKFKINKWNDKSAFVKEDVSEYFSVGYTVTFTALQLAFYMGFKEIILIGVDFSYPIARNSKGKIVRTGIENSVHFYKDNIKEQKYNVFNYEGALQAYKAAYDYAEKENIKIYDATRNGKLEVFKKIVLEDCFA